LAVDATAGDACPPSAAGQVGVFDRGNALVAWPLGGRDLGGRRHIRCGKLVHGSERISLSQVSECEEEREAALRAALAAGTGIRKMAPALVRTDNTTVARIAAQCADRAPFGGAFVVFHGDRTVARRVRA
jgi:hypothetical protein